MEDNNKTTSQYLLDLIFQRLRLVCNLNAKGVEAEIEESFNDLVDKVKKIDVIAVLEMEHAPTSSDTDYNIGTFWIDKETDILYVLKSKNGNSAVWQQIFTVNDLADLELVQDLEKLLLPIDNTDANKVGTARLEIVNGSLKASELKGKQGDAAGFGNITASAISVAPTQPAKLTVTTSGADTAKNIDFRAEIPAAFKGDKPNHQWLDTSLRFERPDGEWGATVDLKGKDFRYDYIFISIAQMNAAIATAKDGEFAIIQSPEGAAHEDNAKVYTLQTISGVKQWIFLSDFSGATGDTGKTGATPNITITTKTLSAGSVATVAKSGTAENPVFDIGIPKGDDGDTSEAERIAGEALSTASKSVKDIADFKADITEQQGVFEQRITNDVTIATAFSTTANENSVIARGQSQEVLDAKNSGELDGEDGKSAYQLAVDNGFVGTETEWLASLVGRDGRDGKDAANAVIINENIFLGFEQQQEYDEGDYTVYPIKVLGAGSMEFTAASVDADGYTETTITVTGV